MKVLITIFSGLLVVGCGALGASSKERKLVGTYEYLRKKETAKIVLYIEVFGHVESDMGIPRLGNPCIAKEYKNGKKVEQEINDLGWRINGADRLVIYTPLPGLFMPRYYRQYSINSDGSLTEYSKSSWGLFSPREPSLIPESDRKTYKKIK